MKRVFDVTVSLLLLILLSGPMILVAFLIRRNLGSPVLFKQKRIGRHHVPFYICKFRTMTNETDAQGELLPDDIRMTKLGSWIRSMSIDEWPQLFNILKGEMSLIGPRPLLPEYLPYYSEEELERHSVRPGITGLAQVEGRNFLTWERRFELDVQYVKNRTFLLDLQILMKTFFKVVQRKDIEAVPGDSMPDFDVERKRKQEEKPIITKGRRPS